MDAGEILAIRKSLGLTQSQLAAKLGVHQVTIARWERGVMKPSPLAVKALEALKLEKRAKQFRKGSKAMRQNSVTLPKGKPIRQLARELGLSASYLSQVAHGKRPPSAKLVEMLNSRRDGVKQNCQSVKQSRYNAELCSGSTGDFGSLSPGSNPGSAANT